MNIHNVKEAPRADSWELEACEIRTRCEQATAGPWVHLTGCYIECEGEVRRTIGVTCRNSMQGADLLPALANAEFIAHARMDVPRLLEEVLRLRHILEHIADGQIAFPQEYAASALHDDAISRAV